MNLNKLVYFVQLTRFWFVLLHTTNNIKILPGLCLKMFNLTRGYSNKKKKRQNHTRDGRAHD